MPASELTATVRQKTRESGLDTSNGLEFVQQRIGLFAKLIAIISLAFLIVGAVGAMALQLSEDLTLRPVSHVAGLTLMTVVWLACRRGRFGLAALERLDAVSLIGSCTAWAFFIEPPVLETFRGQPRRSP